MQEHDARVLRGAAIPTLIAGGGSAVVFFAVSGTAGVLGAVAALVLVAAFFGASGFAVARISRRNPELFLPALMGTFLVKAVILAVALLLLRGVGPLDWLDTTAFAITALISVVAWLGGHTRVLATAKTPHVEPVPPGSEPRHENA